MRLNSGIVIVGVVLGVSVTLFFGLGWKDQQDFLKQSQLYEDTANGFTFRFPNTWDVIAKDTDLVVRNEQFTVGVNLVGEPSTAVGVIVQEHSTQDAVDSEQLLTDIQQQLTAELTDFTLLKSKTKNYSTYSVLDIEYTHKQAAKTFVQQRQRIFVTDKNNYIISGTSLLVNYPQRKKDINHILDSFTLSAVTPAS